MKVTVNSMLPLVLGAVPVLVVVALVGFIAFSGLKQAAPASLSNGPGTTTTPGGLGGSSTTTTAPTGSQSTSGSGSGGSQGLCLPLVGCL